MGTSGNETYPGKRTWPGRVKKAIGNWAYRLYLALGVLLVILVVAFTLIPQVKAGFQTGIFVLQVLDGPFKPQGWFSAEPLREEIVYPLPGGEGAADIYRIPDDRKRAAIMIFLGANATGRDDQDVINLGNALAGAGYVTMFHWSPTMGLQHNIDPDEVENLVWAFQYLREQDFVDRQRVGMGGFSVGASFAIVAAADPRIRDDVQFVNAFGAYYDVRDLFIQVASSTHFYKGQQQPWQVDRLTRLVFANELIETLEDPQERSTFARNLSGRGEVSLEDVGQLSPRALTVLTLLEGTTLEEADRLLGELPEDFRQEMARISPSAHISDVEARFLIMHDQADLLIPVVESRRLAEALKGRSDVRYTETEIFEHVRPGSSTDAWLLLSEGAKLYSHMYGIIRIAARGQG